MSEKRKPSVLSSVVEDNQATLQLLIDSDLLDLKGHFTHFPLLPGVTQIDWAVHYAQEMLGVTPHFQGMEVVKFQEPIRPNTQVTLSLNWDNTKEKLAFSFTSEREGETVKHSSGKLKLSAPSEASGQ